MISFFRIWEWFQHHHDHTVQSILTLLHEQALVDELERMFDLDFFDLSKLPFPLLKKPEEEDVLGKLDAELEEGV